MDSPNFIAEVSSVLDPQQILSKPEQIERYSKGIRVGGGSAQMVLRPHTLLEFWYLLEFCVRHKKIIIVQAANTGVTGGSTPFGDDYDREIIIISTLAINQTVLLNNGSQVLAYAGSTLYELEDKLEAIHRAPHSVIGSSCIGASIVGGVCNNSGGSLVNRGPAYTEYSLYAAVDEQGKLGLYNELGGRLESELGSSPVEVLKKLDKGGFPTQDKFDDGKLASDVEYQHRVRQVEEASPSRYNSDPRRLHKASGCAGKLAVFAVRLDTFEKPKREQVFYLGTHNPDDLNLVRKAVLTEFKSLPELGEYMHQSYFDAADKYCKDTFLIIKKLGTRYLTRLWSLNASIENTLQRLRVFPERFADRMTLFFARLLPDHLPKRVRQYRKDYQHHLIIKAIDKNIEEMEALMQRISKSGEFSGGYFECDQKEAEAALLHRFVAGGAMARIASFDKDNVEGMMPLDVALRRNDDAWQELLDLIPSEQARPLVLSHFFCNVFHLDFIVNKGVDIEALKQRVVKKLDARGAKYPAEHNVGHYYEAEPSHKAFYQELDPTNTFNAGVGRMSKKEFYS